MVAGLSETLKEPTMTKLTDTQLIILGKACERPDGAVYPLTTKLRPPRTINATSVWA